MSKESQEIADDVQEVEVLNINVCIASVTKDGGVHLKCEQNVDKIDIDEQVLSMIKGVSELAVRKPKDKDE